MHKHAEKSDWTASYLNLHHCPVSSSGQALKCRQDQILFILPSFTQLGLLPSKRVYDRARKHTHAKIIVLVKIDKDKMTHAYFCILSLEKHAHVSVYQGFSQWRPLQTPKKIESTTVSITVNSSCEEIYNLNPCAKHGATVWHQKKKHVCGFGKMYNLQVVITQILSIKLSWVF